MENNTSRIDYVDKALLKPKQNFFNSFAVFEPNKFFRRYPNTAERLLDPEFYNLNETKQMILLHEARNEDLNTTNNRKIAPEIFSNEWFINLINFSLASNNVELAASILADPDIQPKYNILSNIEFYDSDREQTFNEAKDLAIEMVAKNMVENNQTEPPANFVIFYDKKSLNDFNVTCDRIKKEKGYEISTNEPKNESIFTIVWNGIKSIINGISSIWNGISQLFNFSNNQNAKSEDQNQEQQIKKNEQQNNEKTITEMQQNNLEMQQNNDEIELDDLDNQSPKSPLAKIKNATAPVVPTQKNENPELI